MQKLKINKIINCLGGVSMVGLFALVLLMVVPSVHMEASADARTTINANVTPVMSIALADNNIDIALTPTMSGDYNVGSSKLTVNTNNSTGYQIFMHTSSGEATLVSKNGDKIMPMAGNEFSDNTWGYSFGASYTAVPAMETSVMNKTTSGADTYDLSFGVKVDSAIPAGSYTNEVILSAVANPTTLTDMMDLFYMQDMTSSLCQATLGTDGNPVSATLHNAPSRQLIDMRDGKTYWVSKLADGNCWMVQNLALDLDSDKPLTPVDSDVAANWVPTTTERGIPERIEGGGPATAMRSWNLGEYALTNSTDSTICKNASGVKPDSVTDDGWNSVWGGGDLKDCNRLEKYNGTQDRHYLIGNYYQWNTATAGSGREIINSNAKDSICPKGWKLPMSGESYNTTSGSFYYLLNGYGLQSDLSSGSYNIATEPLYFVRAGYIDPNTASLRTTGHAGLYWSSTAANPDIYNLHFNSMSSNPFRLLERQLGFTVRCVAR